ncbi:RNA-guided endonuclease InsQ/TnpB family protein [Dactylosporangium sp. NPDC000521]|uniref:RNA-guided endonuclease InsQ/TnpB family protein n=1 Tax=Dactylosporangium sp. NPDC000521 TaxID=3363975 RepID=UPI0036A3A209
MEEVVRYNYRLRPGATAVAALMAEWGRCRWLWNEAVHQQRSGGKPTFAKLCRLLTEARARNAWLRDGSQVVQQQVLRTYGLALMHSFTIKGRGRPRLKKRSRTLPTLDYTVRGFTLHGGRLRLAGGIIIPVVWSRDLPSKPSSVRVYQDCLGHWYASFVVRRERADAPEVTGSIGIDWGVATTAATTDPAYDLPYHGFRKRCAAELAKAQRKMARRRPPNGHAGSKGYLRAKRQAAKLHKRAARQNRHTTRIWAKSVVDNHQIIAVEDFKPAFLAKSTMARKAADAAIGAAKRELIERGTRAGRKVVLVPPAYTTMTCSGCFARATQRLGLGARTFVCTTCGHTAGRDENAARVILATVERDRAGVDGVRHAITSSGSGLHAA